MMQTLTIGSLTLKAPALTDAPFYFQYRSDPSIAASEGRVPDETPAASLAFLEKIRGHNGSANLAWVIFLTASATPVGMISLWDFDEQQGAEIAYGLLPAYQGHGYMTLALQRVEQFAREATELTNLQVYTAAVNAPSRRLLERQQYQLQEELVEDNLAGVATKMVRYQKLLAAK